MGASDACRVAIRCKIAYASRVRRQKFRPVLMVFLRKSLLLRCEALQPRFHSNQKSLPAQGSRFVYALWLLQPLLAVNISCISHS